MPVTVAALLALGIVMALFLLTTGAVEDVPPTWSASGR